MKKLLPVFLVFFMLVVMIPVTSAFAYTDGLLNGKTLTLSTDIEGKIFEQVRTTTLLTDNNQTTSEVLQRSPVSNVVARAWYNLGKNTPISAYAVKVSSGSASNLVLHFFDINKNYIAGSNLLSPVGDGSVVRLPATINNVYYVGVTEYGYSQVTISEFDVFSPPAAPVLQGEAADASGVLNWNAVPKAVRYNVKRSTNPSGPYATIAANVMSTTYTDANLINGFNYYYVVTTENDKGESVNSNEVVISPKKVNRAILTVTLDGGQEKEFEISTAEVSSFIAWYEAKAAGSGPGTYAVNKHDNNKGPFLSRKDYLIYGKIVSFEVSEYQLVTTLGAANQ